MEWSSSIGIFRTHCSVNAPGPGDCWYLQYCFVIQPIAQYCMLTLSLNTTMIIDDPRIIERREHIFQYAVVMSVWLPSFIIGENYKRINIIAVDIDQQVDDGSARIGMCTWTVVAKISIFKSMILPSRECSTCRVFLCCYLLKIPWQFSVTLEPCA